MKKFECMMLGLFLCMGMLTGCGSTVESETSVVYIGKKGAVISVDVETLDKDYYDADELETFVDDAVSAYTKENGSGTVKVEDLTVEDGTARLQMKYKTASDYAAFNGIELYQGTVIEAVAAGYVFEGDFARVEDGEVVGSATKQEIYAANDLKVAIIRANEDVQVEGEICYVSCENVKLTGKDSVSIREGYRIQTTSETGEENVMTTEVSEQEETSETVDAVTEEGSFETEVYTFIVYK